MVRRSFSLINSSSKGKDEDDQMTGVVELRTLYEAATNRLLRVAVNGFMESVVLVLGVMCELDVDVIGKAEV